MKISKNAWWTAGVVLFVMLGFLCGYFVGYDYNQETQIVQLPQTVEAQAPSETGEPSPDQEEGTYYFVVAENDEALCLYQVQNGQSTLLKRKTISLGMFPSEDRKALTEGIRVQEKETALEMIENFVS